jgi:hypothetical protein
MDRSRVMVEAETGMIQPKGKGYPEPEEATRGRKDPSPQLQEEVWPDFKFWPLELFKDKFLLF